MKLLMDPVTAAAIFIIVGLVSYNATRSPENEDNLEIQSFFCLGICAKVEGDHHSPATDEEQRNESTNSGNDSDTGRMRDNNNDS